VGIVCQTVIQMKAFFLIKCATVSRNTKMPGSIPGFPVTLGPVVLIGAPSSEPFAPLD
jgi:hypothetical protein